MTDDLLLWEGTGGGAIRQRDEGNVRRITLDRPRQKNAVSADMWLALAEGVRAGPGGPKIILLESAVDGMFSAGADLAEFRKASEDTDFCRRTIAAMRKGLDAVMQSPAVTVAVMRGEAYGAGLGLALACDLRLVAEGAKMAITAVKMGLAYPREDIERLIRIGGDGLAREMLLTGRHLSARDAERRGLVTRCVRDAEMDQALEALLGDLEKTAGESVLRLKALMETAFKGQAAGQEADRLFREAFASETFKDRLAAFEARKR